VTIINNNIRQHVEEDSKLKTYFQRENMMLELFLNKLRLKTTSEWP